MVLGHHNHGNPVPELHHQAARIIIRLVLAAVKHPESGVLQDLFQKHELLLQRFRGRGPGSLVIRVQFPAERIPCLVEHEGHMIRLLLLKQGDHCL